MERIKPVSNYIFYVYILFDWLGCPRYVGKGHGNRWEHHERKNSGNPLKDKFIKETLAILNDVPKIKIRENLNEKDAFIIEMMFIKALGRIDLGTGCLTNMSDGGLGGQAGIKLPPETIERRRQQMIGRKFPNRRRPPRESVERARLKNTGRKRTPEQRALMGKAQIGNKGRLGKPHTAETKAKMSQAKLGITFSDEHKAKLSAAKIGNSNHLGHKQSDFSKEKISVSKRATTLRRDFERCLPYLTLPNDPTDQLPNHLLWIRNLPKDSLYNPPY